MVRFTLKLFLLFLFIISSISSHALSASVKSLIKTQSKATPNIGIYVKNLTKDKVIAEYNSLKKFIPASNQKIITTIASLELLGVDYKFKTIFFIPLAENESGEYVSNLYIDTKGDPTFTSSSLRKAIYYFKKQGVKKINGNIFLNNQYYEDPFYNPNWKKSWVGLAWAPYISSIAVDSNLYKHKSSPDLLLTDNPLYLLGVKIRRELNRQGISFKGGIKIAHIPISKKLSPYKIKYEHESSDLINIVKIINKKSNNLYAEHVFKKLSANFSRERGSWISSSDLVSNFLVKNVGLAPKSFNISDGSGLSSKNNISPKAMVKLLEFITTREYYSRFSKTLPVAGVDGTLLRKFQRKPLHKNLRAKTGYIFGVSALSGFFNGKNGDLYAFSIIVNKHNYSIRTFIDRLLSEIYFF